MDASRRASIRDALQKFRTTVAQQNFHLLRLLVEGMDSQPRPYDMTDGWLQARQTDWFSFHLGFSITDIASAPHDLLEEKMQSTLITKHFMDGTLHESVDLDVRQTWFDRIEDEIRARGIIVSHFPPADLAYLSTLTEGILAPGLTSWRQRKQFDLFSPQSPLEPTEKTRCRVTVPVRDDGDEALDPNELTDLTYVWEDWAIAVAFKLGDGPRSWGGSYALYCQRKDDSTSDWDWRYGMHDGDWASEVYRDSESYLAYYAHHREQTDEDAKRALQDVGSLR